MSCTLSSDIYVSATNNILAVNSILWAQNHLSMRDFFNQEDPSYNFLKIVIERKTSPEILDNVDHDYIAPETQINADFIDDNIDESDEEADKEFQI